MEHELSCELSCPGTIAGHKKLTMIMPRTPLSNDHSQDGDHACVARDAA
jgi:hypothetical protein